MSTTTTTESETRLNTSLEHAKALQKALADAPLRIVNDKERFKNLTGELASELEWAAPGEEGLADPKSVAEDLADQIVSSTDTLYLTILMEVSISRTYGSSSTIIWSKLQKTNMSR